MKTPLHHLTTLTRPRLLIRAARFGLDRYDRRSGLRRILRDEAPVAPGRALAALVEVEAAHEDRRVADDASYSPARHVEALIALLAEARDAARAATAAQAGDGADHAADECDDRAGGDAPALPAPAQPADEAAAQTSSAFRFSMKASSSSDTPGSISGAS